MTNLQCSHCKRAFVRPYLIAAKRKARPQFCTRACLSAERKVRAAASAPARFWSKVEKGHGCWPWKGHVTASGYGWVNFNRKPQLAHRVAYRLSRGPVPHGLNVCHSCDNPPCCNPDHLWVGTDRDNTDDMRAKGRGRIPLPRYGARHHASKLTARAVAEIRAGGRTDRFFADKFGVSPVAVRNARIGKTWREVGDA